MDFTQEELQDLAGVEHEVATPKADEPIVEHIENQIENGLYILVDDRERQVAPYFKLYPEYEIPHRIGRLTTGDYAIMYRGFVLMTIERKTWRDLAASLRDNRSKNVENLIQARAKTGCHIIYLIEGTPCPNDHAKFGRIPYKCLRAHLDHLAFRDNIHMAYAKNETETARRLLEIAQNYSTIHPSPLRSIDIKLDGDVKEAKGADEDMLKEKKPLTDKMVRYAMWKAIPHITYKTASLIIDKGFHIGDFILGKIDRNTLACLRYPSGQIIGKKATKMLQIKNTDNPENKKFYIEILSNIPLISKPTAIKIIDDPEIAGDITKIIKGEISAKHLAEIQKTDRVHLGKKAAENILKFLCPDDLRPDPRDANKPKRIKKVKNKLSN